MSIVVPHWLVQVISTGVYLTFFALVESFMFLAIAWAFKKTGLMVKIMRDTVRSERGEDKKDER